MYIFFYNFSKRLWAHTFMDYKPELQQIIYMRLHFLNTTRNNVLATFSRMKSIYSLLNYFFVTAVTFYKSKIKTSTFRYSTQKNLFSSGYAGRNEKVVTIWCFQEVLLCLYRVTLVPSNERWKVCNFFSWKHLISQQWHKVKLNIH